MKNPYPKIPDKIPLWRRILARIGIPTIVYWDKEHFTAPTPIYVAWCKLHKIYFLDYPHGYKGYLYCPKCLDTIVKVIKKEVKMNEKVVMEN